MYLIEGLEEEAWGIWCIVYDVVVELCPYFSQCLPPGLGVD